MEATTSAVENARENKFSIFLVTDSGKTWRPIYTCVEADCVRKSYEEALKEFPSGHLVLAKILPVKVNYSIDFQQVDF